jgi:hypothetical protein
MPLLLFWPIIPTILFLGLTAYSVIIAAYLISSDDIAGAFSSVAATAAKNTIDFNSTKIEALPSKTVQQALLAFHTFGFLWTNQVS